MQKQLRAMLKHEETSGSWSIIGEVFGKNTQHEVSSVDIFDGNKLTKVNNRATVEATIIVTT